MTWIFVAILAATISFALSWAVAITRSMLRFRDFERSHDCGRR